MLFRSLTKGKRSKNSESLLLALLAGTIGEGLAITFSTFCKTSSKLPKSEDILSGKLKKFKHRPDKIVKEKRTPKHYDKRDENSLFGY